MITKGQRELFQRSIVAQHDDQDYQESGYVAVVVGQWAALTKYGHCSCYDTWADITGGGISDDEGPNDPRWDWTGTPDELVAIAKAGEDHCLKGRPIDVQDYDFDHLAEVHRQIIEWDKGGRP